MPVIVRPSVVPAPVPPPSIVTLSSSLCFDNSSISDGTTSSLVLLTVEFLVVFVSESN